MIGMRDKIIEANGRTIIRRIKTVFASLQSEHYVCIKLSVFVSERTSSTISNSLGSSRTLSLSLPLLLLMISSSTTHIHVAHTTPQRTTIVRSITTLNSDYNSNNNDDDIFYTDTSANMTITTPLSLFLSFFLSLFLSFSSSLFFLFFLRSQLKCSKCKFPYSIIIITFLYVITIRSDNNMKKLI